MITGIDRQDLLHTKLHRSRVTADLVDRPRLNELLNNGLDSSLILVSAPAGFGKSTLLSDWLETCDIPNAWVSLDEADNNLGVFLTYLLAAMQSIFPDALAQTRSFLSSINLPTAAVIAHSLINELVELGRDFVLVLDDYHVIHEQSIHELLYLLLQHPPKGMHLVIATRHDPLLPIGVLRARAQIAEVRGQDLRFSRTEVASFVEHALGTPLTSEAVEVLAEKTEGWAVGLRLAILSLRHGGDVDSRLAELNVENRYVIDYLLSEVLSQAPPDIERFLLKTSILDQMCGSLCKEVLGPEEAACEPHEYLTWLEQANMFTVAMDSRGEWYRYHHLFRELLRDQLTHQVNASEIATLHTRASAWFARHDSLELALQHALLGNDTPAAVRLFGEHRQALMNSEQWQLLERYLHMFPAETVTDHPDLLLARAWLTELNRSDPQYVRETVDRAADLLVKSAGESSHNASLLGEIDVLRAMAAWMVARDPEHVIALTRRGLATTPRTWYLVRAVAWLRLAVAYQMTGLLDLAYASLAEGQPEDVAQNGAIYARVAGSRCFVEWIAGDLPAMLQGATQLLAVGERHRRHESLGWAHYFLACAAYQRNDLATAETHALALEQIRYIGRSITYLQSAFIYALICQARCQPDEARGKLKQAFEFLTETRSEGLLPLAEAFQAELAMMQGELRATRHWTTAVGPFLAPTAMPYFYAPQLTLPKILLAQDTPVSREQAAVALSRLHAFVTATHNTRFTIEVLTLQAMLHDAQGDQRAALALLQEAVLLAEPGGFIRLFVDLGPRLASLFVRLQQTGVAPAHTGQIVQAFSASRPAAPHAVTDGSSAGRTELIEPLTEREREILALIAQRFSNKEIAQALVISPLTVKRHATTIYSKLQANGRRDAVAKAINLGLL